MNKFKLVHMGGGTNQFNLDVSGQIETPTYRIPIGVNNYNDIYIKCSNLTGTGNFVVQFTIGSTILSVRSADYLSSSEKYCHLIVQRISKSDFLITNRIINAVTTNIVSVATPTAVTYDDRISKVTITTGISSNNINTCSYEIYGRNLTDE